MIFAARGILVSLAFFVLVYNFLSVLALLTWQSISFFSRPRLASVNVLFWLRVMPFGLSAAVSLFLAFPSFLLLETHTMDERLHTFALGASALLVLGAGLYRVMTAAVRTRRVVSECLQAAKGLETDAAISAVVSPQSVSPLMLIGIRMPRVLISTAARHVLSDEELRAAVRHEIEHQRSHDNLKKLVFNCIPFPGMAGLERAWQEAAELAADYGAVSSRKEALDLAAALIKLSRRFPSQAAPAFTTGLVSGSAVTTRVERLLAWKAVPATARSRWRRAIPLALIVTVGLGLVANLGPALILVHSLTERFVP